MFLGLSVSILPTFFIVFATEKMIILIQIAKIKKNHWNFVSIC